MSVIEASSGTYRSRVDGTIVLSVEISPIHRAAALELFAMPGTPMALAALKVGHAAKSDEPAEKPKGGPLARSAGIICGDRLFQAYASHKGYAATAEGARSLVLNFCSVESRCDLDHSEEAASRYARLMEKFRQWQRTAPA